MSVEFYRESPGKFDSRTLNRKTLKRWTRRNCIIETSASGLLVSNVLIRCVVEGNI